MGFPIHCRWLVVLDGQEMGAVLADVDGGDTFGGEDLAVGKSEPLSEKPDVAGVGAEGVGAPGRRSLTCNSDLGRCLGSPSPEYSLRADEMQIWPRYP